MIPISLGERNLLAQAALASLDEDFQIIREGRVDDGVGGHTRGPVPGETVRGHLIPSSGLVSTQERVVAGRLGDIHSVRIMLGPGASVTETDRLKRISTGKEYAISDASEVMGGLVREVVAVRVK